jgi:ubiquinone/menaquinone biosynthesis C-methylase UbiE
MDEGFRKDLSHLSWDEIYARQALRAPLIEGWIAAVRLGPGDRVLEVGSGPGFVSQALAARVGRQGIVYAVEKSAEALAYLERLQREQDLPQIRRVHADAAICEPAERNLKAALVTMVLHHADDPAAILRGAARWLAPGGRMAIGEFDPAGPCEKGPPRGHRLALETVRGWCEDAGLAVLEVRHQTPEHYLVVAERRD